MKIYCTLQIGNCDFPFVIDTDKIEDEIHIDATSHNDDDYGPFRADMAR